MLAFLAPLFFGAIPSIVSAIADAKVKLANAETDKQRIEAEEHVKALEAQRDVLVAESTTPWNQVARAALLVPAGVYLWWITIWDKIACKWFFTENVCTTDKLSDWQIGVFGMMIGFYFVGDISKIWKR